MAEAQGTWLTQDAYDKLKNELDHISGPYRDEIVDRIARARDEGDLKENGGYHAARDEQGKNEARIRELTEKLRSAQIGTPLDDGVVEPGMLVVVNVAGDEMKFLLGGREISGTVEDTDVFSPTSPLGKAINGLKVGEKSSYQTPSGMTVDVEVISAKPFVG